MFLLDDILLAPLKGMLWLGEKIDDAFKAQQENETSVKDGLLELQMRLEMDQISPEDYRRQEAELLQRLETIREEKQEE